MQFQNVLNEIPLNIVCRPCAICCLGLTPDPPTTQSKISHLKMGASIYLDHIHTLFAPMRAILILLFFQGRYTSTGRINTRVPSKNHIELLFSVYFFNKTPVQYRR